MVTWNLLFVVQFKKAYIYPTACVVSTNHIVYDSDILVLYHLALDASFWIPKSIPVSENLF